MFDKPRLLTFCSTHLRLVALAAFLSLTLGVPTAPAYAQDEDPVDEEAADPGGGDDAEGGDEAEPSLCRPAQIMILIDNSASFNPSATREAFLEGIGKYLTNIGEEHRVGLASFGVDGRILVPLTKNAPELREQVLGKIGELRYNEPWTSLYSGVAEVWREIGEDRSWRGVIVIVSDGIISVDRDNPASIEQERVYTRNLFPTMRKLDTQIHALTYDGGGKSQPDAVFMKEMADGTGGVSAMGTVEELPAIIDRFGRELCESDPKAEELRRKRDRWREIKAGTAVPPTPPPPVAPPPVAPPPVAAAGGGAGGAGGSAALWIGLIGVGVIGASVTGFMLARRRRRQRPVAAAVAGGGFSGGVSELATAGAAAVALPRAAGGGRSTGFTGVFSSADIAVIPEELPPKPAMGTARPLHDEATRVRPAYTDLATGAPVARDPEPPKSDADTGGAIVRKKGPPPKPTAPPKRGGQNLVWIIGYDRHGDALRQAEFRGNGDVLTVIGKRAGAVLDAPDDRVIGTLRLTVDKDGERIVTVQDVPPGGFRDCDSGRALGEGARLRNNMRFAWAHENRGRYCEVVFK